MTSNLRELTATYEGHTDIYNPVKFSMPIPEFLPTSNARGRVFFVWGGDKAHEQGFVLGERYAVVLDVAARKILSARRVG